LRSYCDHRARHRNLTSSSVSPLCKERVPRDTARCHSAKWRCHCATSRYFRNSTVLLLVGCSSFLYSIFSICPQSSGCTPSGNSKKKKKKRRRGLRLNIVSDKPAADPCFVHAKIHSIQLTLFDTMSRDSRDESHNHSVSPGTQTAGQPPPACRKLQNNAKRNASRRQFSNRMVHRSPRVRKRVVKLYPVPTSRLKSVGPPLPSPKNSAPQRTALQSQTPQKQMSTRQKRTTLL
jgi:hypothetical protein